jgi:hypothetical protein
VRDTPALQHYPHSARQATNTRPFELLARAGFISRGALYAIVGILAIKLAAGLGGKATDQKGALQTIAHQPFGRILLILMVIGFVGYGLWRYVQAGFGHGPEGGGDPSAMGRVAAFASGTVYLFFAALSVLILTGDGGGSGDAQKATGGVLDWPAGRWLVGGAGLIFIGIACYQAHLGLSQKFLEQSKTEEMSRPVRRWIELIGMFGITARAVVFAMVGFFLIKAAIEYNPDEAVGLDGVLLELVNGPYGAYLLGIIAAGLIAFGTYSLTDARYRRI